MNVVSKRALQDVKVGISVGRGSDLAAMGFSIEELNRIYFSLCETLMGEGAHIVLGHRWAKGGIFDVILNAAIYQNTGKHQITNLLAWPNQPGLNAEELAVYEDLLEIRQVGKPENENDLRLPSHDPKMRELKDEAFTKMRNEMANLVDVLICLGGKTAGQTGRISGILEEFLAATKANKPVFISKLIGGAAKLIAQVIESGESKEWAIDQLLNQAHLTETEKEDLRATLSNLSLNTLSDRNGMSPEEYMQFMNASTRDEFLVLLIRALRRLFDGRTSR